MRVEYDATRLNAAMVTQLVRRAGVQIAEELPLDSASARTRTGPRRLIAPSA